MSNIDDELQAHFGALRVGDERSVPAFSDMVRGADTAPAETSRRTVRVVWWLAAASVLIASTTLLMRRSAPAPDNVDAVLRDTAMLRRLSSWSSPTDGLLRISDTLLVSPAATTPQLPRRK